MNALKTLRRAETMRLADASDAGAIKTCFISLPRAARTEMNIKMGDTRELIDYAV